MQNMLKKKGNDQAVTQLDKVLVKENDRYGRAMKRLKTKDQEAAQRFKRLLEDVDRGKGRSKRAEKAKGVVDKAKRKGKGPSKTGETEED